MLRVIYPDVGQQPSAATAPLPTDPVVFGAGFHGEEREDSESFHWMAAEGTLEFEPSSSPRFLEMRLFSPYYDLSQTLTVSLGGESHELPLPHSWAPVSLPVPAGVSGARLSASRLLPDAHHPGDPRELSVRVRFPRLHTDADRHAHLASQQRNAVLNLTEMLDGRVALASTPRSLGIDMYGVCNVKPPCVYCDWDFSKDLEGDKVDAAFGPETLDSWGPLFDNASNLVNCSIGEPFMMKNFDELLDAFGEQGKSLEMATNGQILTDKNIQKLLGRRIHLYISLDAATPETYAKLRNTKFEKILDNLRRLIPAKGGREGLPKVHMVFMPMRVNLHELPAFVRLCAELGVDRMVLRPLNYNQSTELDWERGGHHFEYDKELLPWDELVRASGRAAELCRLYGVELSDQMDFGGSMERRFAEEYERGRREGAAIYAEHRPAKGTESRAGANGSNGAPAQAAAPEPMAAPAGSPLPVLNSPPPGPAPSLGEEKVPLCTEPWKSLYILRRGIMPCCYGSSPIASMEEHAETWNGPLMQEIRRDLAGGRFHEYCLSAEACPIVRKTQAEHSFTRGERMFMAIKRGWQRVDRLGGGVPGKLLGPVKRPLAGAARRATSWVGG
jgi:MoaA/NifB/PqqE/SkfB family radical SAM enzyme